MRRYSVPWRTGAMPPSWPALCRMLPWHVGLRGLPTVVHLLPLPPFSPFLPKFPDRAILFLSRAPPSPPSLPSSPSSLPSVPVKSKGVASSAASSASSSAAKSNQGGPGSTSSSSTSRLGRRPPGPIPATPASPRRRRPFPRPPGEACVPFGLSSRPLPLSCRRSPGAVAVGRCPAVAVRPAWRPAWTGREAGSLCRWPGLTLGLGRPRGRQIGRASCRERVYVLV